ncbi:zinc finger protein 585A-like isoform X2 [Culicoides brevitarsis]|uniref:zinc finger protein 585A-like isoform X2 n=1 Tax=Culicoides brevitarsis TaxID=469753 RepID=UPI00307B4E31
MDFVEKTAEKLLNLLEEYGPDSRISFPKDSDLQNKFEEFCNKTLRKSRLSKDWHMLELKREYEEPTFSSVETRLIQFLKQRPTILSGNSNLANEQKCRFCLSTTLNELQIFSQVDKGILDVALKFFQVRCIDGFPQYICVKCLEQLNTIQKFHKLTEVSHIKLLSLAAKECCQHKLHSDSNSAAETKQTPIDNEDDVFSDTEEFQTTGDRENVTVKNHFCEYCPKSFKTKLSLKVHIRSHTNERPFVCSECKMSFKTYSAISSHQAVHSKEKKFECYVSECSFRTTTKANLKIHERTHSQERRYACSYCALKFTTTSNLSKHVKNIHHQIKPHKCRQCEKKVIL